MKNFNSFINENNLNKKSVNIEFEKVKLCKFASIKHLTLEDMVEKWDSIKNIRNDNIDTIKYFVNNPNILKNEVLLYDSKGLSDGYHRLIAMKILNFKNFNFDFDNLDKY